MIGKRFEKPLIDTEPYSECAEWCNETQKAYIEDKGDYYECVAIPEPTAEELAEQELQQKKAERAETVSKIKVTVDGMDFDGDKTAQTNMAEAILTAQLNFEDWRNEKTRWVLYDNTIAEVTIGQLAQALTLAKLSLSELWMKPYED